MIIPKIKFCGFLVLDDIHDAESIGMDFAGLNFVPSSKRVIDRERAKSFVNQVRASTPVGIFLESQGDDILHIASDAGITWLQIYRESLEPFIRPDGWVVIHAFRSIPETHDLRRIMEPQDYILLDGPANGIEADLDRIAELPKDLRDRLFIAGGLTPVNVDQIVKRIQPFAVDTASGIEHAPGHKDPSRMRAFVDAVRSASLV